MKLHIFIVLFLLAAGRVSGQVEGSIRDINEQALPGVLVTALDSATKKIDSVKSDKRGFYFFASLKPGVYQIDLKAAGFIPVSKRVIVKEAPPYADAGDDTYYALRRDFILKKNEEP